MIVVYILLFLLILGIVVCFHEFGHYFFAKKAGIQINEFAFGMGPKIISKKIKDTYWSLRAFPIGGFCAMSGEDADTQIVKEGMEVRILKDENGIVRKIVLNKDLKEFEDLELVKVEKIDLYGEGGKDLFINDYIVDRDALLVYSKKEEYKVAPEERNYVSKTVWQRFMVCFGGPFNNLILGLFVFLILGMIVGVSDSSSTVIGESASSKLESGDRITAIDGYETNKWSDVGEGIYSSSNRDITVEFVRDGENRSEIIRACYAFNNFGIASSSDDGVVVVVEEESNFVGYNRTKAYTAGLRNGYIVVGLRYYSDKNNNEDYIDKDINSWDDLLNFSLETVDGGAIKFNYKEEIDGEIKTTDKIEVYSNELLESQGYDQNAYKLLNISASTKFDFFGGILNGLEYFIQAAGTIFSTLGLLLFSSEVGLKDMGGFITILDQTANYASSITSLLYWVGLLSVNLGIVNLLPIPALDGGRILFIIIEGITGKKLKPKTENIIINVFFYLLIALIIYVLINDIIRLGGKI